MEIRLQVLTGHTSIFFENKHIFLLITDTVADAILCPVLLRESQKYCSQYFFYKTRHYQLFYFRVHVLHSLGIFPFLLIVLFCILSLLKCI